MQVFVHTSHPGFPASQKIAIVQLEYEASPGSLRKVQMTMTSMKIRQRVWGALAIAAITGLVLGVALPTGKAAAQSAKDLVGSWTFIATDIVLPDGKRVQTYGPNLQGLLIFGADGRFANVVTRSDRAKFASNDRMTGTPEENKATVQGTLAFFGRYTVNESERTIFLNVEHSTFPNWNGTVQKRPFTLTGDELKWTVASPAGVVEVVLKRAK